MTVRTDFTIDWSLSPRIITVAAPSTEVTIQDLVDTCRVIESAIGAMDDDSIISAAGKEDLGGGTAVGITATLLNTLLAFEARGGPSYTQCSVSGGNVVAIDSVGDTFTTPISPTAFTQVVVTASSSATTTSQAQLEFSTFNGGVSLDTTGGVPGTAYPIGTPGSPVSNLDDAQTISVFRGFSTIFVVGDFMFGVTDSIDGYNFIGESASKTLITLTPSATIINCKFASATIEGTLDGGTDIVRCHINDLNYVDGNVRDCQLNGTLLLGGDKAALIRCWSGVAGINTPFIDMGGTGTELLIRDYQGGIELNNYISGSDNISIDMASGHIILADTILSGFFLIRGQAKLTDLSNGAVVNSEDLINKALLTDITLLLQEVKAKVPVATENAEAIWNFDPIDVDDEELTGSLLLEMAEKVESKLVVPPTAVENADAVWDKEL